MRSLCILVCMIYRYIAHSSVIVKSVHVSSFRRDDDEYYSVVHQGAAVQAQICMAVWCEINELYLTGRKISNRFYLAF